MSSRAAKKRAWRKVWAKHGWSADPLADRLVCKCGVDVDGMTAVQMGATWTKHVQAEHLDWAYRNAMGHKAGYPHALMNMFRLARPLDFVPATDVSVFSGYEVLETPNALC